MNSSRNQGDAHGSTPRRRRVTPLTALVATMVVFVLGAWVGASFITTPRQAALEASAPSPSVILGEVEERVVEQRIVTRGELSSEATVSALPGSVPTGAQLAVLSKPLPELGSALEAGDVVAEVSGRPVIVLPGAVPMYRDLGPGSEGADVRQLQEALTAAGHEVGGEAGVFGEATLAAVRALYAQAGQRPPDGPVPVGELLFVGELPVRVVAARGKVGARTEDAELVVASGETAVHARVTPAQLALLQPGDKVELTVAGDGTVVHGSVGTLDVVAPAGADEAEHRFASINHDQPIPGSWLGQGLRVEIIMSSSGERSLAVPIGAVFLTAEGDHEVIMVEGDAERPAELRYSHVPVVIGATGGGWASVEAEGGVLDAGTKILLSTPPER